MNNTKIESLKIGFLGAGKMGGALIEGLTSQYPDIQLFVYDKIAAALDPLRKNKNISIQNSESELENSSDVVILCIKPQDMISALADFKGNKKYISIAAGVSVSVIIKTLGKQSIVSRVMPNMAASIQKSVSSFFCEDENLSEITGNIFQTMGRVFRLTRESDINAATGLAGSGPAFVFAMIQAMAEGGVRSGLPYNISLEMAALTFQGASELLIQSGRHPDELRNSVTSPGGTTIAGLEVLEKGGLHGLIMSAVHAAKIRSDELENG